MRKKEKERGEGDNSTKQQFNNKKKLFSFSQYRE